MEIHLKEVPSVEGVNSTMLLYLTVLVEIKGRVLSPAPAKLQMMTSRL